MNHSLILAASCAFLLAWGVPASAVGQSPSDSATYETEQAEELITGRRRPHRQRRHWEDEWIRPVDEPGEMLGISSGFVCINGTLLAAPYDLKWDASQITVNGQKIPTPTYQGYEPVTAAQLATELCDGAALWVDEDFCTVLTQGNGLFEFAMYFSCQVAGEEPPAEYVTDFLDVIQRREEISRFVSRWGDVVVPVDVADRIQALVDVIQVLEREVVAARDATYRLNSLAYPLTVFGMLMCVLTFGHLLAYPPFGFNAMHIAPESPIAVHAAIRSLGLIAVLSCMDLLWTMLASQAGQMRELNPLGSRMISDPTALIGFKFLATGVGVALLFAIRRNHAAQVASWWMCMVLALLSMRWVAFNSLFVA